MPMLLEDPIAHMLARLQSDAPRWIIGMVGVPGSGKSTLAAHLAQAVNARTASDTLVALSMDGFHLTKAELQRMPDPAQAFARRGAPWTFDPKAFAQRLRSLRDAAGRETVWWPDFQHEVGDPIEAAHVVPPATRLILIEGLYLLHDNDGWEGISPLFDERWYIDTPLDIALERLALRHMAAWGHTRAHAEQRIATNDRLNAELVLQGRDRAQWLV